MYDSYGAGYGVGRGGWDYGYGRGSYDGGYGVEFGYGRGRGRGGGRGRGRSQGGGDTSGVRCYRCQAKGHFANGYVNPQRSLEEAIREEEKEKKGASE